MDQSIDDFIIERAVGKWDQVRRSTSSRLRPQVTGYWGDDLEGYILTAASSTLSLWFQAAMR